MTPAEELIAFIRVIRSNFSPAETHQITERAIHNEELAFRAYVVAFTEVVGDSPALTALWLS